MPQHLYVHHVLGMNFQARIYLITNLHKYNKLQCFTRTSDDGQHHQFLSDKHKCLTYNYKDKKARSFPTQSQDYHHNSNKNKFQTRLLKLRFK